MTYRDELTAAHAHNEILRQRVAELEARAKTPPSERLVDLIERGRETRSRRQQRAAREAQRQRRAAERAKIHEQRNERVARTHRIRKTFGRLDIRRYMVLPPLIAWGIVMFTIPLFIFSGIYRMIAIPILGLAFVWPLIAVACDRLLNGDAGARERAWLDKLPFESRGLFELIDARHVAADVHVTARFAGRQPEPAMVADVLAGLGLRGAVGEMIARTQIRATGDGLELQPPELPRSDRLHRHVRDWYRAIAAALAELQPHFPAAVVQLRHKRP